MKSKFWKPFVLILILNVMTVSTQTRRAYALPEISFILQENTAEVGGDFWVALYITGVQAPGATAWQVTLKYDSSILTIENLDTDIVEGNWLKDFGAIPTYFSASSTPLGITVACMITQPNPGRYGSGTMANIKFTVIGPGGCSLGLSDTLLVDADDAPIDHTIVPGTFYTDQPKADFSYSFRDDDLRDSPIMGETITFNATYDPSTGRGSYDPNPGGEIIEYRWDFGDGTVIAYVLGENLTAIASHSYTPNGDYSVTLPVTDNNFDLGPLTHSSTRQLHVALRDLAITNMKIKPAAAVEGTIVHVNVTVKNLGTEAEYFNLTLYYDSTMIYYNVTPGYLHRTAFCLALENGTDPRPPGIALLPGESLTIRFNWTTTGVPEAFYAIRANVSIIPNYQEFDRFLEDVEVNYANNEKLGTAIITSEPINIAITDITVSPKVIAVGQGPTSISVAVSNEGTFEETFSVSVFYNSTLIENRTSVYLAPKASTTEIFSWDTAGLVKGTYIISANASLVPNEMIPDDNTFTYPDNVIISDPPVASFTYTPDTPRAGDTVSFDASGSSDPDGTIIDYIWGFGDGTALTHGITASHMYLQAETYDVNLTVTDNAKLNTTLTMQIIVDKSFSTITLSVSPTTLTFGNKVTINGKITPPRSQVDVLLMLKIQGEQTWSNLATPKTNATGYYSSSWTPPSAKTYQIQAKWTGDTNTFPSFSTILNVTVNKIASEITSSANPKTLTVGSGVTVTGKITPTRSGVIVTIQARFNGEAESAIGTATTDSTGAYSSTWTPEEAGTYEVRAIWSGDDNTLSDQSEWETVTINEAAPPIPIYYIAGGIAVVAIIIAAIVYFVKFRKP